MHNEVDEVWATVVAEASGGASPEQKNGVVPGGEQAPPGEGNGRSRRPWVAVPILPFSMYMFLQASCCFCLRDQGRDTLDATRAPALGRISARGNPGEQPTLMMLAGDSSGRTSRELSAQCREEDDSSVRCCK